MAEEDLREYLRRQSESLNSLLALTPAKMMFGEDVSDQWQRRKQTLEQKQAARMAKLDPANWKSAKDVYDERSREASKKRRRETVEDKDPVQAESTKPAEPPVKKAKVSNAEKHAHLGKIGEKPADEAIQNANLKKKLKKRANRIKKNEELRERREAKKLQAESGIGSESVGPSSKGKVEAGNDQNKLDKPSKPKKRKAEVLKAHQDEDENSLMQIDDFSALQEIEDSVMPESGDEIGTEDEGEQDTQNVTELPTVVDDDDDDDGDYSTVDSAEEELGIFSPPHDSTGSSVSSVPLPSNGVQPPRPAPKKTTATQALDPEPSTVWSEIDRQAARDRLQQQISQFRTQRKADEKTPRSRADLLAQRRREEEERKAAKKEQKTKEKAEEARRQEEEMVRRFSPGGSGSLLGSPRSPIVSSDGGGSAFTFGRIGFEDGTQLDQKSFSLASAKKRKGPQDVATALKAARNKEIRLEKLDAGKRQDIAEKDMWLNAKKKAFGEKVKDDTSLLKKALKRQDKQKQKSGAEWDKRVETVQSSQEARQKKRNDNIQTRKDSKIARKTGKKVKRPGFEGSFRGRSGKTKRK